MIDPTLIPVIRGLASQVFEAKVIADRLGVMSNFLSVSDTNIPASTLPEVEPQASMVDPNVEILQSKIKELTETITLLTAALLEEDGLPELTDDQTNNVEMMLYQSLKDHPKSQIAAFYDATYFSKCDPTLRKLVAKVLVDEFNRRKATPLSIWLSYIR